ncbi:MAG TPA: nucleotidyltransferase domain-containing protein, partial [Deltaproteobacteria bacterium]|nr:nucleotidyltransferase domain-containing protein [Deltaproteobacteria bacterium]
RYPEIQAVYLFGSRASGKTHPESDLDLAVYPPSKPLKARRLDLMADLVKAGFDRADLSFVEEDGDLVFAYEAVRQNRIVYQTPGFSRGTVYSRIVRKYLDFLPFLNVQRRAYKERLLHGPA